MHTLIIATGNAGKQREIQQMLGDTFEVKTLKDIPNAPEIIEDGDTFEANAIKKARIIADHTGLITLADDSGLEVDCLNGAPGIYSARYAGEGATDKANNQKLLSAIANVPDDQLGAQFHCVMALVDPNGQTQTTDGIWRGHLLRQACGTNGFGYDPLFFVPTHNCASAELPTEQKNELSHRGQALRKILPHILALQEQS
ncbi:MAG: XTP/dITP diphosphatase [Candidatus Latescibacteria bacterium]|jgi:XTP/dITP diphosphohydrolase|nr:XTP/dITP diphosphatase [Candidatus Latescibacterota bacterium]MBT5828836.1 XTP/dITP diphosphatase [Candidatus Latescibacterota bacterium]